MSVKPLSGPDGPRGPQPEAEVTVSSEAGNGNGSDGAAASAVAANSPERKQTVRVRLAIHKPEPFSVNVKTSKAPDFQLISIMVNIYDEDRTVFEGILADAANCDLTDGKSKSFPLSDDQLRDAVPHLQVGNVVEVKVVYVAPVGAELTVGIVGEKDHKSLGELLEKVFHPAH